MHPRRSGAVLLLLLTAATRAGGQPRSPAELEALPYAPRTVVCYRAGTPPVIDGRADDPAWRSTPWSAPFVDIDGVRPVRHATRMKLVWDDTHLYIAAEIEEPDLWATITQRDAVIFQDHDFEVFLDPDGDTHGYYELEVNALGTAWDLFLPKPYRDGGPAIHGWDIAGLKVAVALDGTLNAPGDRDRGWTVEMALPWEALKEAAPGRRAPRAGDRWRLNASRVEWTMDVVDGQYRKRTNPATGRPLPEDNWVWSPQGAIDMHMPERWGVLQFSDAPAGTTEPPVTLNHDDRVAWALRRLYYRQRAYRHVHGAYASTLEALEAPAVLVDGLEVRPTLYVTPSGYELIAPGAQGTTVHLTDDGRVWMDRRPR